MTLLSTVVRIWTVLDFIMPLALMETSTKRKFFGTKKCPYLKTKGDPRPLFGLSLSFDQSLNSAASRDCL